MKNITFLFLLIGGILLAQQPKSFSELSNQNQINEFNGETVLVTGAAGSIGSELVRQLAEFDVKHLILVNNDSLQKCGSKSEHFK